MKIVNKRWFYRGYSALVNIAISEVREYYDRVEEHFNVEIQSLEDEYKSIRSSDEEGECLREDINDRNYGISISLQFFRYSVIVTVYSLLESSMDSLCNYFKRKNNLNIELADLRGDGIDRARSYLKKVCGVDISGLDEKWNKIQNLKKIRNFIAHANGNFKNLHSERKIDEIKSIIRGGGGLNLRDLSYGQELIIEKEYIASSTKIVEDFLMALDERAFPEN